MHKIMEFVLPVIAASAEAMIWVLLIGALVLIGRGKLLPSEKPHNIERTGLYRMRLAPGLNLAQSFIEAVAKQLAPMHGTADGLLASYEVSDKSIATRKQPHYLLLISIRDGLLHFEARAPLADSETLGAGALMPELDSKLADALQFAAEPRGIRLRALETTRAA